MVAPKGLKKYVSFNCHKQTQHLKSIHMFQRIFFTLLVHMVIILFRTIAQPCICYCKASTPFVDLHRRRTTSSLYATTVLNFINQTLEHDILLSGTNPSMLAWCGFQMLGPHKGQLNIHLLLEPSGNTERCENEKEQVACGPNSTDLTQLQQFDGLYLTFFIMVEKIMILWWQYFGATFKTLPTAEQFIVNLSSSVSLSLITT